MDNSLFKKFISIATEEELKAFFDRLPCDTCKETSSTCNVNSVFFNDLFPFSQPTP